MLIKMPKNSKGSFKNTLAKLHIDKKHPDLLAQAQMRQRVAELHHIRQRKKQTQLIEALGGGKSSKQALTSQLKVDIFRFYAYSRQHISKQSLQDPYFRQVIRTAVRLGGGDDTESIPTIQPRDLLAWCHAEQDVFRWHVHRFIEELMDSSRGNRCCQGQHDTVTLENGHCFLAGGLQFMDPSFDENIILCLGFELMTEKDSVAMAAVLDEMCLKTTGRPYRDLAYGTISDHAALGVARVLGHEGWGCDMHDVSKVRSCVLACPRAVWCVCVCVLPVCLVPLSHSLVFLHVS